jgi:nitrile hydratase accessory protein
MKPPASPLTPHELAAHCGDALPLPPRRDDEPVFSAPWQAHAFAMAVHLHQRGLFTWPEWAAALSAEIHGHTPAPDAPEDDGSRYYRHWLDALEKVVVARQAGSAEQLHALEHAWEAAAERTPHGQPIALAPGEVGRLLDGADPAAAQAI